MNRIFYSQVNTMGVRRPNLKASCFRGRGAKRSPNEATASRDCIWAVVHDPEGTIGPAARFGKMDLDHGVTEGVWVHGTVFEQTTTHQLFIFDKKAGKICKLKDRVKLLESRAVPNGH